MPGDRRDHRAWRLPSLRRPGVTRRPARRRAGAGHCTCDQYVTLGCCGRGRGLSWVGFSFCRFLMRLLRGWKRRPWVKRFRPGFRDAPRSAKRTRRDHGRDDDDHPTPKATQQAGTGALGRMPGCSRERRDHPGWTIGFGTAADPDDPQRGDGAPQPLGLFKVLILSSQESERQRGLCGNRPVRIGNVPIVQLTQERDGAVPKTAHLMPDRPPVQTIFIVGHITHPPDPPFHG